MVFLHLYVPSLELQKPAALTFISHQDVPKPGMVLSSHAGHKLGFASQSFLHLFLFFLHLVPLVDLHVSNSVSQMALQSAKTTHGGGEATGAEGAGGGEATGAEGAGGGEATGAGGAGGGGDATGTGGGGEGDATGTGEGGGGDATGTGAGGLGGEGGGGEGGGSGGGEGAVR